jgi:hypothetical protein
MSGVNYTTQSVSLIHKSSCSGKILILLQFLQNSGTQFICTQPGV